jgi:hypothetical protein
MARRVRPKGAKIAQMLEISLDRLRNAQNQIMQSAD